MCLLTTLEEALGPLDNPPLAVRYKRILDKLRASFEAHQPHPPQKGGET
jgi:hypothetical protein